MIIHKGNKKKGKREYKSPNQIRLYRVIEINLVDLY